MSPPFLARTVLARTVLVGLAAIALLQTGCGGDDPSTGGGAGTEAGAVPALDGEPAKVSIDPATELLIGTPNRDLGLLQLMLALNAMHLAMEPRVRTVELYEEFANAADTIASMAEDPSFAGYVNAPDFDRSPRRFEQLRIELLEAARATAAAARAVDREGVFEGYTRMDATCIGCHKRYGPLH